jgi:phosphate transport system substrate-binding protein
MKSLRTLLVLVALTGCSGCIEEQTPSGSPGGGGRAPKVVVDGSSTVQLIASAVMESYSESHEGIQITVSRSGTSAGFQKFAQGEIDICTASRTIKEAEVEACADANIEYVELKIAIDGLSVVVHPDNDWCTSLTVEQLKAIWEDGSEITTWNQIDSSWPSDPIKLYGPDDASGTYDYFQEVILGKDAAGEKVKFRNDYNPSDNDSELVEGVANTPGAMGFFGYAFYADNADSLKLIAVAGEGSEPVLPTPATIEDGTYTPLSRPLYIYINREALERQEVRDFVEYFLSDAGLAHVSEVGYIDLPENELEASRAVLQEALAE